MSSLSYLVATHLKFLSLLNIRSIKWRFLYNLYHITQNFSLRSSRNHNCSMNLSCPIEHIIKNYISFQLLSAPSFCPLLNPKLLCNRIVAQGSSIRFNQKTLYFPTSRTKTVSRFIFYMDYQSAAIQT